MRIIDKIIRELYRIFHPSLWGKRVQINGIPRIYAIHNISFGNNVSVNSDCVLQGYGGIRIGNNVTLSDGAKILTRSLDINNYRENAKKEERDHIDNSVEIEDEVWIAANAVVLPGAHIAKGAVVAAGAVVADNLTQESSLYVGVPARFIREL